MCVHRRAKLVRIFVLITVIKFPKLNFKDGNKMDYTPKKVTVSVKKRKRFSSPTVNAIVNEASVLRNQSSNGVPSDVLGSYTGSPIKDDIPEQDSDDL